MPTHAPATDKIIVRRFCTLPVSSPSPPRFTRVPALSEWVPAHHMSASFTLVGMHLSYERRAAPQGKSCLHAAQTAGIILELTIDGLPFRCCQVETCRTAGKAAQEHPVYMQEFRRKQP
eukprot:1149509-Pelagomonas_calceolata.AAC.6